MPEKTEAPTPRRLADARERGQVARSVELNAAVGLLVGAFLIQSMGGPLVRALQNVLRYSLDALPTVEVTPEWVQELFLYNLSQIVLPLGEIILALMLAGVVITLVQIGLKWASKRKLFDFGRVNPVSGIKRMFSLDGLQQLIKSILKLVVVGYVVYSYFQSRINSILILAGLDLNTSITSWLNLATGLIWNVAIAYMILAIADYIFQRWNFMRQMKMSRQEILDEIKQSEGDPYMRSRIRQAQRQMMARRMMSQVPKADVIITNPTHLAIAVKYDSKKMTAPVVLAKGSLLVAKRIVEVAEDNDIPVVQNIPLARAIFHTVEIDGEIPPQLYRATAEILAYVYKLRKSPYKSKKAHVVNQEMEL